MGVEHTSGTDTRTETVDKPASQERPYTPPPDNPGSSGQPSRLESRARARQAQEQNGSQQTEVKDTGSQPAGERDDKPASPKAEGEGEKAGAAVKPQATDRERDSREPQKDEFGPATGEAARQDGRGQESRPMDAGTPTATAFGTDTPGDRDRPATQPAGERTGNRAPETERPQDEKREPLPRLDDPKPAGNETPPKPTDDGRGPGPGPSGETGGQATGPQETLPDTTPAGPESRDRAAEPTRDSELSPQPLDGADDDRSPLSESAEKAAEQPADRDQEPTGPRPTDVQPRTEEERTGPSSEIARPTEPAADTAAPGGEPGERGPAGEDAPVRTGESTDHGTEIQEPRTDANAPDNEPGGQTADNTPSASEETDRNAGAQELHGEQDDDRGKKAEDGDAEPPPNETNETNPEARANPILSEVYTDSRGQIRVEPRYGREQTGESGTELARNEPESTDPAELPNRQELDPVGARGGGPDRGELRDPEDDPENRDYTESDAEEPSRRLDMFREAFAKADDVKDSIDKLVEPAQKHLERVHPTGQTCGVRGNSDHIKSEDQQPQAGNAALGIVATVILAVEAGRRGVRMTRKLIGADHARN